MTSAYSERARELLTRHDAEVRDVLQKYGASR
ncbi:hypothetical protein JOF57_000829 [Mycolicibacterium lutetiense]|uniref:Uncharacterized protein n=1 Tax=Mycolicibacterium lutetiense TaxID=1641992 RepID=A0ABS4ZN70_9MYCO|nr:hypothetical protein [Mycolicibacterium lutetiense]